MLRPLTKLKTDLKRGAVFEQFVEDWFKARGWACKRSKGYFPFWDLRVTKVSPERLIELLVECKFDEMSEQTGNYCLESRSLRESKAHILIIGTPKEAYCLPMETARLLFNDFPKRQTGDAQDNYSALVPKSVFISNVFKKL